MVLTEIEFENLLSTATKEEFKVPDELNKKLKKRIKNSNLYIKNEPKIKL